MSLIASEIPSDVFECIAKNAGVLLKQFDTSTWTVTRSNIMGATKGGINFKDVPTYKDYGADIDNCPKNTKELKELESREVTAGSTYVSARADEVKNLVAIADKSTQTGNVTKITPRNTLEQDDFIDSIWFVTDYGNGGAIAIRMDNVLNTDGLNFKTTDKEKGEFAFTYMAHYSMSDTSKVPYEVFIKAGTSSS